VTLAYLRLAIIILALAASVACMQPMRSWESGRRVDPELEPYVQSFERAYGAFAGVRVALADLTEDGYGTVGLCQMGGYGVKIDRAYFEYYREWMPEAVEQLVYHELGHCVFGLGHDDHEFGSTGPAPWCPRSVMNPYTLEACFRSYRAYYIGQLAEMAGRPLVEIPTLMVSQKTGEERPTLPRMRMDGHE
jgi:hypothetical protein